MKIFGIAGSSGSGKTVLIERLLPRFASLGLTVAVIKHTHHDFDLDRQGKDSWRHREAGAQEVMVVGPERWALLHENRDGAKAELGELLARLSPCDLVLVEGYKRAPIAKLEVWRAANGKPPLWPDDPHVIAVASDSACATDLPVFRIDDAGAIAGFIVATLGLGPSVQIPATQTPLPLAGDLGAPTGLG